MLRGCVISDPSHFLGAGCAVLSLIVFVDGSKLREWAGVQRLWVVESLSVPAMSVAKQSQFCPSSDACSLHTPHRCTASRQLQFGSSAGARTSETTGKSCL